MNIMLQRSNEIVAGWMAVSLQRARRGFPTPSLAQWHQDGYTMGRTIPVSEWNDMLTWPADSCEGSFIQNPANSFQVSLVRSLVRSGLASDLDLPLAPGLPMEGMSCDEPDRLSLTGLSHRTEQGPATGDYVYVSGTLVNNCRYTQRVSANVKVLVRGNDQGGIYVGSWKLGPGESVRFSDVKSQRVFTNVTGVQGTPRGVYCPERIC